MLTHLFLRWMSLPLATLLAMALAMTMQTPSLGVEAARLAGYIQPDGNKAFALTLRPTVPAVAGPRDVVLLVSTADSQTGEYLAKSLATLQLTLAGLAPNDRVNLVAFDVNAQSLTRGFVSPQGAEMAQAMAALEQRRPLGSCDLEKALDTAGKSFPGGARRRRAIVYIGDGSSRANTLNAGQLEQMVNDLVAQRAPVTTLGIGPRVNEQMLGTLASRTGGVALREQSDVGADAYGASLARSVRGSVLWPKAAGSVKWPDGMEVYPKTLPPLRTDRDTVLVGSGAAKPAAAKQVDINVDAPGGPQKLSWQVPEFKSDPTNSYLATLVDQAKADDGKTLPLVDSESLARARREIAGGRGFSALAREALQSGNLASAENLAAAALRRDPKDPQALAVQKAAAAQTAKAGVDNTGGARLGEHPPQKDDASETVVAQHSATEARTEKEVRIAIDDARKGISGSQELNDKIINALREMTTELDSISELRPETRDRLKRTLHATIQELKRRGEELVYREQERTRREKAQRVREMDNEALTRRREKIHQLMEQSRSLAAEGHYKPAEESAAEAAKMSDKDEPNSRPAALAAVQRARFAGAYDAAMANKVAAERGFLGTMGEVEKSHIPMPDDQPIVYPDAEKWKKLTASRKEKYGGADLSRRSPAEKKIQEALKSSVFHGGPLKVDFDNTPLNDVVDYLKDLCGIEIQLDAAGLKEVGVNVSEPVSKKLKGVSLGSALKLILEGLSSPLKYVVRDDVLLITSPAKAEIVTTKIYPVGDLVVPTK